MPARGRASVLVDEAAERTSVSMRMRAGRLRSSALIIAQTGLAVAVAWFIAAELLGHEQPFFAPVSAVICLGMTYGQRSRRAFEMVIGVAIGIAVADLIVAAIGTGTWQLGVVTVLAMGAAVLLGSGPVLATQAAISAALVVTLQPPGTGLAGGEAPRAGARENTTLAVALTDARLDKRDAWLVARAMAAGVARAVQPAATAFDGDWSVCMASGRAEADPAIVAPLAADAVAAAIRDAVRRA